MQARQWQIPAVDCHKGQSIGVIAHCSGDALFFRMEGESTTADANSVRKSRREEQEVATLSADLDRISSATERDFRHTISTMLRIASKPSAFGVNSKVATMTALSGFYQ